MKCKILLSICGITLFLFSSSCKKNTDTHRSTPVTTDSKAVKVHLNPNGEFTIDQSPLTGGRLKSDGIAAKTLADSTIYCVTVLEGTTVYGAGLFSSIDSISFMLYLNHTYTIELTAIQKGTGPGLYYEPYWDDSDPNFGKPFFSDPFYTFLTNSFSTDNHTRFTDVSGYSFYSSGFTNIGEITTFFGSLSNYTPDSDSNIANIPMKRLVFGIKYNCPQLTQGKITVTYHYDEVYGPTPDKDLYPNTIDNDIAIYSYPQFIDRDTIGYSLNNIQATVNWILDDGRTIHVGDFSHDIPNRNQLLNVNITLPPLNDTSGNNSSLRLQLSETPFTNNTPVNF